MAGLGGIVTQTLAQTQSQRLIRNCSVAVVGGAGFIGSHVVDHLIEERGCKVVVLDNLCAGRKDYIHLKAAFEHCDITGSEEFIRSLFHQHEVEYVFNYASFPYVPDSYKRPLHVFAVNATGAAKIINAAQEAGCKGILQVSSAEVYGRGIKTDSTAHEGHHQTSMAENAPVEPHSSYGASKAAIDSLCQVRWREAGTPVIALRQFNCAGPRDTLHDYVIPAIVRQLLEARSAPGHSSCKDSVTVKLGNNSLRDFMHVKDAAAMAVELLESGRFGEVYNMGSQEAIHVYDLVPLCAKALGMDPANVKVEFDETRARRWEIWSLCSDNAKLHRTIQGRPRHSLTETVEVTVRYLEGAWFKEEWR
jgi:UDP-glucose 4-epimerase